jgi:hypothetical protein
MSHPISPPSERNLLSAVGVVFLIVTIVHLLRLVYNWKVVVDGSVIPMWVSWVGVIIAAYLSYSSFARRSRR